MSTAFVGDEDISLFAVAHEAFDDVAGVELALLPRDDFLQGWRDFERLVNRMAAMRHRFIAEAERQFMPSEYGAKNTAAFLRGLLRVDPYEAAAQVRAADAAASRTTLTGEPQPAPYAHVSAAQATGAISPKHASTIVTAVQRLTPDLQAEHGEQVEAELVELARQFDPAELSKLGVRMTTLLDQDGALNESAERERRRDFTIHQRPDGGSSSSTLEANAELTELLLTTMDALAKPKPEIDGQKDPRTPGQRRHDALLDALKLVARAELLPDAGGVTTTVLLIAHDEDWKAGTGVATTGHGAIIAMPDAIRMATDARFMTVTVNNDGAGDSAVVNWTDTRRLFTENQRLALTARDQGCTFPGCDAPPAWCQAAHIKDHTRGGPTTVDNGTLLCGHHHRYYDKHGWRLIAIDGAPAWIPPPWLDPEQRPIRNHFHRPDC